MEWPETRDVLSAFATASVECRFVGGCVRDALLGFPVSDIDIATPCPPEAVMDLLKKATIKAIPTGLKHGTVTAVIGEKHFEITTLRKDVSTDGRHAEVAFTDDWKEDAQRRDFTMNALYADANGTITDYFNGITDAQNGVVRFIGDARTRIEEDALRILRFFRFSARYAKGNLDEDSLAACEDKRALIDILSGERIQSEMFKLLVSDRAAEMLEIMRVRQILWHALPIMCNPHILVKLQNLENKFGVVRSPIRSLAALIRSKENESKINHDDRLKYFYYRLKFSNQSLHLLRSLSNPFTPPYDIKTAKSFLRKIGKGLFIEEILISGALYDDYVTTLEPFIEMARSWIPPTFPVTGDDLIAAGYASGPSLGAELKRLETLWEESEYTLSKENLLKL
jgi:poly(A) polymerase